MTTASKPTKPRARKPAPKALPDRDPPESMLQFAREHPGLVLGGGLMLGLIIGGLMPRGAIRRLARDAVAVAAVGGEASLAYARHAADSARDAAGEAGTQLRQLEGRAGDSARKLRRTTAKAAGSATSAGLDMTRSVLRLLSSLRR